MSKTTTANPILPRSSLRHRPIGSMKSKEPPAILRASRTPHIATAEMVTVPVFTRIPPAPVPATSQSQMRPWLKQASGGILAALLLVLVIQSLTPWISMTWNDWQYGRPRMFQMDAFV